MATIRREFVLAVPAEAFWDAVRDVGAVHTRLAPGFVVDCHLNGEVRELTFANGLEAIERIVSVDDAERRLAYAVASPRIEHYAASLQVLPDGEGCRVLWQIDVLPHAAAGPVGQMADAGVAAMRQAVVGQNG